MRLGRYLLTAGIVGSAIAAMSAPATAFCGFYVAKADAKLFNEASKVVVARKESRTVVTMASDYKGDPKEFALVVPVPTVIKRSQINLTTNKLVDHLDAYTAPRLVEYHDRNPCAPRRRYRMTTSARPAAGAVYEKRRARAKSLGVKIEAQYSVGEYEILILSAKQSGGLATWLNEQGYKIPAKAHDVLASYIRQDMKFFVAKVNLEKKAALGFNYLRPIQVAFDSARFMLPIRLGTVNASGPQDLLIFMLTERGRVETTNYRTKRIPSNLDVPIFTRDEFGKFYKAMFDHQVKKDGMRAVYLEYAWNMAWCDPCAADPIPNEKLVELGAYWLLDAQTIPTQRQRFRRRNRAQNAFVTRLHVRYAADNFPEDLQFQETADRKNFQGRYVLHHPYTGPAICDAAERYRQRVAERRRQAARNLAELTGWKLENIHKRMNLTKAEISDTPWYERMWGKEQKQ
jgi:hypothetical protein